MSVERIATPFRTAGHGVQAVFKPLLRLWHLAVEGIERRRAHHLVGEMEDRMLRDIGIVRSEAAYAVRHGRPGEKPALPWWGR